MRVSVILFSGPMITAIRERRKVQTRRLAWKRRRHYPGVECAHGYDACPWCDKPRATRWHNARAGDLLWVREAAFYAPGRIAYAADNPAVLPGDRVDGFGPKRPARYMPRRASRITLELTAIRAEPLTAITATDAVAEGVTRLQDRCYAVRGFDCDLAGTRHSSPLVPFAKLWDSLQTKPGDRWEDDPEVFVFSFESHFINVDELLRQREAA